ncbi:TPA: coniferyl aldehyde dehydrogenase [Burkholderia vietnamiensis]|nr:coniferyl aldehyde dehydrogenase [Burkholderia vietnamiensis]HEP6284560.1 coniferyl aldehyde dehydrogenase [Burkholderia vietnamiensis]HEP6309868.1 coniferyl aldehyde dehydrogenase [Burkholderia vietnamiensis]
MPITFIFEQQRLAFLEDMQPSLAARIDRLDRLEKLIVDHQEAWLTAISDDFRHRSRHETLLVDIFSSIALIRHTRRNIKRWMRPRKVATSLMYRPGRNVVLRQPLGVVGVVSPWNYPLYLALGPVAQALAAGNRVMLKPSELTPGFSALLQRAVAERFAPQEFAVITGDAAIGQAFTRMPFDHLLFTGSTPVGRRVAVAAAEQLTPVTLELGGKSPVIVDRSCDLRRTVPRMAYTKVFNAGQTCVAPDYALVPEELEAEFERAFVSSVTKMYPSLLDNPDYSCIVNERHRDRLNRLIEDAQAKGARVVTINPAGEAARDDDGKVLPTLIFGANDSMAVMQEEIFGPVLPVMRYRELSEAIAYVNAHDRPLALYWFGRDARSRDVVLNNTISGGVCINDCMRQVSQDDAPFGGVGASGIGSYHGEAGFVTFSKERTVYHRSDWTPMMALAAPYGVRLEKMLDRLRVLL